MRAVIMREFGPPEVLVAGQAQDPSPGEGEVLVDVELAKSWRTPSGQDLAHERIKRPPSCGVRFVAPHLTARQADRGGSSLSAWYNARSTATTAARITQTFP